MPKIKTKRAAAKRFRVSGKGRVIHGHANVRHNTGKKRSKNKRKLKKTATVAESDRGLVRAMLRNCTFKRG